MLCWFYGYALLYTMYTRINICISYVTAICTDMHTIYVYARMVDRYRETVGTQERKYSYRPYSPYSWSRSVIQIGQFEYKLSAIAGPFKFTGWRKSIESKWNEFLYFNHAFILINKQLRYFKKMSNITFKREIMNIDKNSFIFSSIFILLRYV